MARSSTENRAIRCPSIARQIAFQQLLAAARKTWLLGALGDALRQADPRQVKDQLLKFVPPAALKVLGGAQIRDEHVFPVPVILEIKPTLVGYYRLLAGIPQKSFYAGTTGLATFKSMEVSGILSERQRKQLPEFCRELSRALAELVTQISPMIRAEDVAELPLLTLGAQFQGSNNNRIGQQATKDIFLVLGNLAGSFVKERSQSKIALRNSSGNQVVISLATDPDVRVQLQQENLVRNKLAIEIKGGTDRSNAHNRAGEAEKSHQKARAQDYRECWTLIAMKGLDRAKLRQESPSTDQWFDVAQILAEKGDDWNEFKSRLADVLGIRLASKK
jgi:hypothetical protein